MPGVWNYSWFMNLKINGDVRSFAENELSVVDLLKHLDLEGIPVVVERNEEAMLPREHATAKLEDGDRLEIVRVVAGG